MQFKEGNKKTFSSIKTTPEQIRNSINSFVDWIDKAGYESYDPYDLWGTKYGMFGRRLYYKKSLLGLPFIAPILLIEMFAPGFRKIFVKKQRFATADAQIVLAFLKLYGITHEKVYLIRAQRLADDLMRISIPGFKGFCWGYPFNWQHSGGITPKNTPLITATPYCFEAFFGLFDATGDLRYREIAISSAEFVLKDLNETPTSNTASAGSYTPFDHGKVINASAYRAMVLIEAGVRTQREDYYNAGVRNLNFVIEAQRDDGSWLYALDSPAETFIDHFHTCFVMKNVYKANLHLKRTDVSHALKAGYDYYRKSLFNRNGDPLMYSIAPRVQMITKEFYNYAECITLCCLLKNEFNDALPLAMLLAGQLADKYQVKNGHYITRIFLTGNAHKFPFLRWPQAQLFYAMTNIYESLAGGKKVTASPVSAAKKQI